MNIGLLPLSMGVLTPSFLTLLFMCTLFLQSVHASWWYLGLASSAYQATLESSKLNFRSKCTTIAVFAPRQRELCLKSKNVLDVVSKGASMGIDECQHQFAYRRWNCTTFNNTSVFGKVLSLKSREKAYIYAISAAGVMAAITRACSKGDLHICGCDEKIRHKDTEGEFLWGGCSHNIGFGDRFTREFVDSKEAGITEEGLMNMWNNGVGRKNETLMNLWNNAAGRKTVKNNMKLLCKCHGVSGSCSVKICWRTMASFRIIGANLKDRFDGASRVQLSRKGNKLKAVDRHQKKPTRKDLVYLQESPDFCEFNPSFGSLGTRGRKCNKNSYGLDGCTLMCCGRGYHTLVREIEEDCDCKFFWCCRVECQKCRKVIEEYFCN